MPYNPNLLSRFDGVLNGTWNYWLYRSTDTFATIVNTSNYFADARSRGIKPLDLMIVVDTATPATTFANVLTVTDTTCSIASIGPGPGAPINVLDYGADPTGAGNSAPAFQAAINAAVANGKAVIIPAGRYRIDTALDCHNLENLVLRGDGAETPSFGLALVAPSKGTVIVGNTGAAMIDFVGSNNILIRDIAFTALGASTPSTIGLIFGTSTRTGGTTGAPGGSNICLENVVVQLTSAAGSLPIYFNPGSGLSHFINVWTLGQYGIAATSTNPLAVIPPYGTFGPVTDVDGLLLSGCNLLGYGGGQPLYLEEANDFTAEQTYIATIAGGASYAGQPYAVYMKNMTDAKLKLEVDYFPSVLYSTGTLLNVWIEGIIFQNLTPVPAGVPMIANFDGTSVDNVQMDVRPIHGAMAGSPYHYAVSNTVALFRNVSLGYFLTAVSPNVLNSNLAAGGAYINLIMRGDSDTPANVLNINGVLAAYPSLRYSINGFPNRQIINSNPVALPNPPGGTVLQVGNANAGQTRIFADSFGGFASISLRRANNTNASPAALASGDIIGSVDWYGYGTAYTSAQASIRCLANETWNGSANGNLITFSTTPNTTTTLTERMRVYDDGGVVIAAPAGASKGAGTLNAVGVYAAGVLLTSDAKLKTDIAPLPEALPIVAAIEPKSFRWKEPAEVPVDADGNPIPLGPPGHFEQINRGFLAQDVAAVIGGKDDAVDLGAMFAVLWQAVREMSDKIALLEAKP